MDPDSSENLRKQVDAYCVPENEVTADATEVMSPSGRYRLIIRSYAAPTSHWHFSGGTVVRVSDGIEIADIKRDYDLCLHSFVVKDGHEWLVTGRSYTSQTIVDLDAAREYEPPGDPYAADHFCWTGASLSPDGNTLAVEGCYWGCPYENRFYDFTDPARGWPEILVENDRHVGGGRRPAAWQLDGSIDCYETEGDEVGARTRLRRDGNVMRIVEDWLSDDERIRRSARAKA